jgi:hypothetical protein
LVNSKLSKKEGYQVRKYLAIVLGVLFILSFTATAFAIHETGEPAISKGAQIVLGGKILVRGWYFDNASSSYLPTSTDSQAMYSTNANIMIDANVSDNVRGFMELETSSGDNPDSGLYYWGSIDTKPKADLYFRQLWIQYTGSGIGAPSGIKAGHMPITLGEKQFLCNERFGDDAILLWVDPTKEVHLVLGTTKLSEGLNTVHSDDLDGYVLIATYMVNKDNTIGLNYTFVHTDGLDLDGAGPLTTDKLNFDNLGLHANGKVSGLTYAAEVDFQFGKLDGLTAASDKKFSGYGIFAKLGYMVDPVGLRASFAMGSGDSDPSNDKNKEFQTLQGPDAVGATARLVHYTQIYERTIRTAANEQTLTGAVRNNGIANTTYYNLGMDVNPTKEINLSLDGFIIRATKAWQADQSKSVGSEVDFKGTYKIAKNLSYFVEAGVFTPGKFYTTGALPVNQGADKKTVTQAVHGLLLTF